jgi:hypothetical protein
MKHVVKQAQAVENASFPPPGLSSRAVVAPNAPDNAENLAFSDGHLLEAVFGSVRGISEESGTIGCVGQDPCRRPLSASPVPVSWGSWTVRA